MTSAVSNTVEVNVSTPLAPFLLNIGGPNSTGPYAGTGDGVGFYDGNTGTAILIGSTTPSPLQWNGSTIDVIAWSGALVGLGSVPGFTVAIQGTHPQNFFASIALAAPVNLTFLTAAAGYFSTTFVAGYTVWEWADSHEYSHIGASPTCTMS